MWLNPRVTLLCFDPREPLRSLEVRGRVVEMTEVGAMEHLDGLAERYTGAKPYFGSCVPVGVQRAGNPGAVQDPAYPHLYIGRTKEGGVP